MGVGGEGKGSGVMTGLEKPFGLETPLGLRRVGEVIVRADSLFEGGNEGRNELNSLFIVSGSFVEEWSGEVCFFFFFEV